MSKDHYDPDAWKAWAPRPPMPAHKIPPQRQKILDFVISEVAADRPFPGPTMISRYMGWKTPTSAADVLFKLCTYDRVLSRKNGVYSIRGGLNARAA